MTRTDPPSIATDPLLTGSRGECAGFTLRLPALSSSFDIRTAPRNSVDPKRSSPRWADFPSKGGLGEVRRRISDPDCGPAHDQNFANQDPLLKALGNWTPDQGLTVHAFVSNMNNGGYVLVEAADPNVVYSFVSKFVYWNDVNVVPVVDVADGTASLTWARSAVKG